MGSTRGVQCYTCHAVQWRQQAEAERGRGLDGRVSLPAAGRSVNGRGPLGETPDMERLVRPERQWQDSGGDVP